MVFNIWIHNNNYDIESMIQIKMFLKCKQVILMKTIISFSRKNTLNSKWCVSG